MSGAQLPQVSVIVPVYNMADYVARCLHSICAIDCQRLEIIVIDDGSKDDSLAICQAKLAGRDDVKILTQANAGQGVARNYGLQHATGKYVLFVDSDDTVDPRIISCTLPLMEESNYDFINFGLDFVSEDGRVSHSIVPGRHKELKGRAIFERAMMDEEILSSPVNKLYSRAFLERHNVRFPETRGCEDIFFSRALALHASATGFVAEVLYHALVRYGSTTRSAGAGLLIAALEVLAIEKRYLQEQGVYQMYSELYQRHYAKQIAYIFYVLAYRAKNLQVYTDAVRLARQEPDFQRLAANGKWGDVGLKYRVVLMGSRFPFMLRAMASVLALLNVKPY